MAKTVVILGAGWAGLPLAHKLLKYTLPKVKDLKIILVSPNTHFYWNLAAVRGVIPGAFTDDQLFLPIQTGFARYPDGSFQFILGRASSIDPASNMVKIIKNDEFQTSLYYDQLVIATGSQILNNLPLKPVGTHEETTKALHYLQRQIGAAKSIVIAGAGPTGVETAGEIAAHYGAEKEITLLIGGNHALEASNVLPSVSHIVEKDLQKLGVKLIRNAKVDGTHASENGDGNTTNKTTITLSNGSTIVADLYLPLFGIKLNTNFVPATFLDPTGSIILDKMMRVTGTKNIWAIGDVGNLEPKQVTVIDAMIIHMSAALDSALTGMGEVKEYKLGKPMIFISMGKKYGTGQIGGWKLWGLLVAYVKGRNIFVDTAKQYVDGKALRHAAM
ncbi:FAD/NAD(P)-binding domain-containing protein [Stipitochalara longipes BDJ]|nr:FAD/NAD(P)-binding domain-containing protein [Stipitochalara longipes BDJ]